MKKIPETMGGQLMLLIIAAIFFSQTAILFFILSEKKGNFGEQEEQAYLNNLISTYKIISSLSGNTREQAIYLSSNPDISFSISSDPVSTAEISGRDNFARALKSKINTGPVYVLEKPVTLSTMLSFWFSDRMDECFDSGDLEQLPQHCPSITLSLPLNKTEWLNVKLVQEPGEALVLFPVILSALLTLAGILIVVVFAVKRITSPLSTLAQAAERLGRGETVEPLKKRGPRELSSTIEAFNVMQQRLTRFVQDRTKMLASISHDLRTPLTSLRLRVEFIEDKDLRDKMTATLEEMQNMVATCLIFSSQDAVKEKNSNFDIVRALQELTDEFSGVSFTGRVPSYQYSGRRISLKRAFRNILENGINYGFQVQMSFEDYQDHLVITMQDKGPGIPEEKKEDIFEPFVRLGKERNTESGNVGLGMSIARTIIHHHGGSIVASNTNPGLRVTITLPVTQGI